MGRTQDFFDKFVGAVLQHFGSAIENLAAKISSSFRPAIEGIPGGNDRIAKVFARSVTNVVQLLTPARYGRQVAATFAADETAANVKLVGFPDVEARSCGFGIVQAGAT